MTEQESTLHEIIDALALSTKHLAAASAGLGQSINYLVGATQNPELLPESLQSSSVKRAYILSSHAVKTAESASLMASTLGSVTQMISGGH